MNYTALDEALKYLNNEDDVVNESVLSVIGILMMAPYIAMVAAVLLFLPSMLIDSSKRNKLFNNNRKFFDAFNKFSDKYAQYLKKAMPKYGKYISSRKINSAKDIHSWNMKEKYFTIAALKFDIKLFKNDIKDIKWDSIHKIYEYYGDEFDREEDSMDVIDDDNENIAEIKDNWIKLNKLKEEVRNEYSTAIKQVKEYFNTNGCPSVISFSLFGEESKEDNEERNQSFDDLFIYNSIYSGSKDFMMGNIAVYFGKGLDKVKMPEEMRKEIEKLQ